MEKVVTLFNMGDNPDLVHKKALTVEEIELTRPPCPKCGEKTELVDGCVFFYIYKCPKCGEEIKR